MTDRPPDVPPACPVCVGRERPLAVLRETVEVVAAGQGRAVLVSGEPGIGKSRLVGVFTAWARGRGMPVLSGQQAAGASAPLGGVAEALLGWARSVGQPPALGPYLPVLGTLVPEWRRGRAVAEAPTVLAEALLRLLTALATESGCAVLALEDVHRADPDTVEVLRYLVEHSSGAPVLCLFTVDPDVAGVGGDLAAEWIHRGQALPVRLDRLTADQVAELARAMLGSEEIPAALPGLLHSRSAGVPLLAEALLAALVAEGVLHRDADGWRLGQPQSVLVPGSVAGSVARRLARLDPAHRAVVEAAAVLGDRFDWRLLPQVSDQHPDDVAAALAAGARLHLFAATGDEHRIDFAHPLVRDAVVAGVLPPVRTALARRALASLEAAGDLTGGPVEQILDVVDLAVRAGDQHRAVGLLLRAASGALAAGALSTSEALLRRALSAVRPGEPRQLDVQERLVETLTLAGKAAEALVVGEQAMAAARRCGATAGGSGRLPLLVARAALVDNRPDVARHHLDLAAGGCGGTDPALRVLSARLALHTGEVDRACALASGVIDSAAGPAPPDVLCEAHEVLGLGRRPAQPDAARRAFRAAEDLAVRHGLAGWRLRAAKELAITDLLTTMNLDRLLAARELALEHGAVLAAAQLDLHLAGAFVHRFAGEQALEVATRCLEVSRRFDLPSLPMALVVTGAAHAILGSAGELAAVSAEVERLRPVDANALAGIHGHGHAVRALLVGDLAGARAHLDTAMTWWRRAGSRNPYVFTGLWALLRAVHERDSAAVAEVWRSPARAVPLARALVYLAQAAVRGQAAAGGQGPSGRAERWVRRAGRILDPVEGSEWTRYLGLTLLAEAALRDGWGDPVRWLRDSLEMFRREGAAPLASHCRALLRRAGAPVPRIRKGGREVPWHLFELGVTPREMDVLVLAAGGCTNREIAARLHLSVRTVDTHVARLLAKTGAANRTLLARLITPESAILGSGSRRSPDRGRERAQIGGV